MKPQRPRKLSASGAAAFRKRGFRKWYERQLLAGHAHMLLAFLSVIAMLASMEAFRDASSAEKLMDAVFVVICAALALWALRKYLFLLMYAEEIANQATCSSCGEYGRFQVVGTREVADEIEVCCRKCAHHWVIGG